MTKSKSSFKSSSSKPKITTRTASKTGRLIVKNKQTGKPLRECCILGCAVVSDTPHRLNGMAGTYEVKPNSTSDYVCRTHWNVDYNRFKRNKKKNASKKSSNKSKKKKTTTTRSSKRSYSPDVPSVRHRKSISELDIDLSKHKPALKKHRKNLQSRSPSNNPRLKDERFSKPSPSSKTPSPTIHLDYEYNMMSPMKQQEFYIFDRPVVTPWVNTFENSELPFGPPYDSSFSGENQFIADYPDRLPNRQPIERAQPHNHQSRRPYFRANDPTKPSVLRSSSTLGVSSVSSKYSSKMSLLPNSNSGYYGSHYSSSNSNQSDDDSGPIPSISQHCTRQLVPPASSSSSSSTRLPPSSLQIPVNSFKRSPVPGYPIPSYPGNPLSIPFRLTSVLDRSALTNLSLLGHRLSRSQSPKYSVSDEYKYGPPTPPNSYPVNSSSTSRWSVKTPDKFPSPSPSSTSFHQYIMCQVKEMVES